MVDISLDLNPANIAQPGYKDLLVVDRDLALTSDANPSGTNPVLQNILQRLRFFATHLVQKRLHGIVLGVHSQEQFP